MKGATKDLQRLVALVGQKLAEADELVGDLPSSRYHEWRGRRDRADRAMMDFFRAEAHAEFRIRPSDSHSVTMAGLRASSTMGFAGALRNWQTAAEKRIGGAKAVQP